MGPDRPGGLSFAAVPTVSPSQHSLSAQLVDPGSSWGTAFGGLLLLIAGVITVRLGIGTAVIAPVTAAPIVSAGVLLALVFLLVAGALRLGRSVHTVATPALELRAHRPMGTQD